MKTVTELEAEVTRLKQQVRELEHTLLLNDKAHAEETLAPRALRAWEFGAAMFRLDSRLPEGRVVATDISYEYERTRRYTMTGDVLLGPDDFGPIMVHACFLISQMQPQTTDPPPDTLKHKPYGAGGDSEG